MALSKPVKPKVRLVPEEPVAVVEDDALGFNAYAQTLADAAREAVQPLTIGIFGEWGTGKSSLMRMVRNGLRKHREIVTVECNAWQFQHEEQPLFPLIAAVVRHFDDYRSGQTQALDAMLHHLESAAARGGKPVGEEQWPITQVGAAPADMPDRLDALLARSQYSRAFRLLAEIEVPRGWKFVVFVDDLDRCSPQRAVRLLESIKLVLDQPGFVFVIGVSRAVLEEHLTHLYREEMGVKNFNGASYLEKLVQLPFPIPSHRDRIGGLARRLAERIDEPDLETLLELLATVFDYNPRALIRVVNNLIIDRSITENLRADGKMDEVPLAMFAVSRALQHRWPAVHRVLELSRRELALAVAGWEHGVIPDPAASPDLQSPLSGDETFLAGELRKSVELKNLLFSDAGIRWLRDENARVAAAQFVRQHKREIDPATSSRAAPVFDAFISYPTEFAHIAEGLRGYLEDNKFLVFLDRVSIGAGEQLQNSMEASLRSARALLFLCGPRTPTSSFQRQEALAMLDRQTDSDPPLIIPVLLPGASVELLSTVLPELVKFQAVDLNKGDPPYSAAFATIARALHRTIKQAAS
ncbi:MAG: P-loop NTPase fold protein [Planctomycetes bacterium]|jgi:hypothetical protein|nr:P-loop NTPase fold protein [Planctomycetota bacterium]